MHPKFLLTAPREITGDELEHIKEEIREAFGTRRHVRIVRAGDAIGWTVESLAIPEEGTEDEPLQAD